MNKFLKTLLNIIIYTMAGFFTLTIAASLIALSMFLAIPLMILLVTNTLHGVIFLAIMGICWYVGKVMLNDKE